jgi:tRNA A37 threonylcarbamoyladenosine dehydratase
MDDRQRLRYSRHLLLNEFGEEAQERLLGAHALVIGAGGLGSAALLYLASSGVAASRVCDGDKVDLTQPAAPGGASQRLDRQAQGRVRAAHTFADQS